MIPNSSDDQPPPAPRSRFQFHLSTLFLLMLMVSVLAAAAAGLVRSDPARTAVPREIYLAMLIAAPLGVMILLSAYYALLRWWGRKPRQEDRDPPESL